MYLKGPPAINHPLISGEWPYYLINLEFIVLLLLFLTYHIFNSPILSNKNKKINVLDTMKIGFLKDIEARVSISPSTSEKYIKS